MGCGVPGGEHRQTPVEGQCYTKSLPYSFLDRVSNPTGSSVWINWQASEFLGTDYFCSVNVGETDSCSHAWLCVCVGGWSGV